MSPGFIEAINKELEANIDQDYRNTIRDHFQMNVDDFLGVRMPVIRKISSNEFDKTKSVNEIYEHKIIAFLWVKNARENFCLSTSIHSTIGFPNT